MNEAAIVRAEEWRRIYEADGGLKEVFDTIRMEYFKRAGLVEPWEADKLGKLAMAGRIVDMVESHFRAVIETGEIAADEQARADKIAELPLHKRKWLR